MFGQRPPSVSSESSAPEKSVIAQRRFVRATVDVPVDYAVEGRPDRRPARIDDLSGGGVRLETEEDLAAGTNLRITFAVGDLPVEPACRVVMSIYDGARSRYLHGIAFTAIEPAAREAILQHVGRLQPAEG